MFMRVFISIFALVFLKLFWKEDCYVLFICYYDLYYISKENHNLIKSLSELNIFVFC